MSARASVVIIVQVIDILTAVKAERVALASLLELESQSRT
jgi:hypothetical protein